jgi:hypothetical protein
MKKAFLALLLLLPLSGCVHQGGGYAGGGAGYFYDECLYPDGCYDGIYRPGYFYYFDGTRTPRVIERARVTTVERARTTRVVTRQPVSRPPAAGSISARSAPRASNPRSAPASAARAGGHR